MSRVEIPENIRASVRRAAGDRCGYCRSPQHLVMGKLEIEHIIPRSRGGTDEESNLWLSCSLCNRYKGTQVEAADPETNKVVQLFNPRTTLHDSNSPGAILHPSRRSQPRRC